MMDRKLEEICGAYPECPELVSFYEIWGNKPYLAELFEALDACNPDWNREKQLGSWAVEFMNGILDTEEVDLETATSDERKAYFREKLEIQYEDFVRMHQFARLNQANADIRLKDMLYPDLTAYLSREGEKTGFPILK